MKKDNMNINDRLNQEASEINLSIIRSAMPSDNLGKRPDKYRLYRFNACGHTKFLLTAAVALNQVKCKECQYEQRAKEALEKGLELVREANSDDIGKCKSDYGLYKFNSCGHSKLIRASEVKNGNFKCVECLDTKLKQEAKEAGVELLTSNEKAKAHGSLYKFIDCGHEQNLQYIHIRNKNIRCQQCYVAKLNKEAQDKGLSIVSNGEMEPVRDKKGNRLYKFNDCGHFSLINSTKVALGKFMCQQCYHDKLEKERVEAGVTYIREPHSTPDELYLKDSYKSLHKINSCGHFQFLRQDAIRNRSFVCNTCNATSYTKESGLYLFKIKTQDFEWLKLGVSKNQELRTKQYGLVSGCEIILIKSFTVSTGKTAIKIEKQLHKSLKSRRLCHKLMKNYMLRSGFTECYPSHMEVQITKQMEAILNG